MKKRNVIKTMLIFHKDIKTEQKLLSNGVNRYFLLILLLWSFAISGCSSMATSIKITPQQLQQEITSNRQEIKTLKGFMRVQLETSLGNYTLGQRFFYLKPDKLRLETVGFFGIPLIITIIKQDTFQMFIPWRNILVKGQRNTLGMTFDLSDLIEVLVKGDVFLPPEKESYQIKETKSYYIVSWVEEDLGQKIWLDKQKKLIVRQEQTDKNGKLLRKVQRKSFIKIDGQFYPRKLIILDAQLKEKITMQLTKLEVNPVIPEADFDLKLPSKVTETTLEDLLQGKIR